MQHPLMLTITMIIFCQEQHWHFQGSDGVRLIELMATDTADVFFSFQSQWHSIYYRLAKTARVTQSFCRPSATQRATTSAWTATLQVSSPSKILSQFVLVLAGIESIGHPMATTITFGDRALSRAAPRLWNSLTQPICNSLYSSPASKCTFSSKKNRQKDDSGVDHEAEGGGGVDRECAAGGVGLGKKVCTSVCVSASPM